MAIYNRDQHNPNKLGYWEQPSVESQRQIDKMESLVKQYGLNVGQKYIFDGGQELSVLRISWPQFTYHEGCEVHRWGRDGKPAVWDAPDNTGNEVDVFIDDWKRIGVDDLEKVFAKFGKPVSVASALGIKPTPRDVTAAAKVRMKAERDEAAAETAARARGEGKPVKKAADMLYEPAVETNVSPEVEEEVRNKRGRK